LRGIYRGEEGRRLISVLAPQQLFREEVIKRLGEHSGESSMPTMSTAASSVIELGIVVFRLGDDEYALPIDAVEEIAEVPAEVRRVPRTPKFLEGVVNLRGSVLPVIDQRRRFDMPPAGSSTRRRLVVVRTDRHRAGLIVDSVTDVLRIPADSVKPAPELTDDITRLVRGVVNLEQSRRIILLLDSSELLTRAERGLLSKFTAESQQAGP
jgi:purine-binding chemotaxis protein CheW